MVKAKKNMSSVAESLGVSRSTVSLVEDTAASRLGEYLDTASVIPDAVVCANDRMAIGAVRSLLNRGLRVPEDVAVCGSEGIELVDYVNPTIATWNQHSKKIGQRAFELLWDKVNGKEVKNAVVEASLKSGRSIPQE